MGLDISHDAFSASYNTFNHFRQAVAKACGGSYPPHKNPELSDDLVYYPSKGFRQTNPGLDEFFRHSDCDGEIAPDICGKLADEMEALIPALEALGVEGGYANMARRFIAGCRSAHQAGEPLEFS